MKNRVQLILDDYLEKDTKIIGKVISNSCGKHRYLTIVLMEKNSNRKAQITVSQGIMYRNWFRLKKYITFITKEAIEIYFREEIEEVNKQEVINKLLAGFKYIADMDGMAGEDFMDEWTEAASFTMCQDLANDMLEKYGKQGTSDDK